MLLIILWVDFLINRRWDGWDNITIIGQVSNYIKIEGLILYGVGLNLFLDSSLPVLYSKISLNSFPVVF